MSEKRLNGSTPDFLDFEDEFAHYERLARKSMSPEEWEELQRMVRPTQFKNLPGGRRLICFGTGNGDVKWKLWQKP